MNYHGVTSKERNKFARQMDELIRLSNPVFPDIKGPLISNHHYIAVTFNDGFQSVIENALPELR